MTDRARRFAEDVAAGNATPTAGSPTIRTSAQSTGERAAGRRKSAIVRKFRTGEASQGPTGAALANAVFDAVGVRLRDIPFTPARVKAALQA